MNPFIECSKERRAQQRVLDSSALQTTEVSSSNKTFAAFFGASKQNLDLPCDAEYNNINEFRDWILSQVHFDIFCVENGTSVPLRSLLQLEEKKGEFSILLKPRRRFPREERLPSYRAERNAESLEGRESNGSASHFLRYTSPSSLHIPPQYTPSDSSTEVMSRNGSWCVYSTSVSGVQAGWKLGYLASVTNISSVRVYRLQSGRLSASNLFDVNSEDTKIFLVQQGTDIDFQPNERLFVGDSSVEAALFQRASKRKTVWVVLERDSAEVDDIIMEEEFPLKCIWRIGKPLKNTSLTASHAALEQRIADQLQLAALHSTSISDETYVFSGGSGIGYGRDPVTHTEHLMKVSKGGGPSRGRQGKRNRSD